MLRVKICGLTNPEDALCAVKAGADAAGFVFAKSPRRVNPDTVRDIIRKLPPFIQTVGVFVDEEIETARRIRGHCGLDVVQLHGREDDEYIRALGGRVIKGLSVGNGELDINGYETATLLLDAYSPGMSGGTGKTFDWQKAIEPAQKRPIILAGGLNPDNVARAVKQVKPYAVDVSSGVEIENGRKDHDSIIRFVRNAKAA